MGFRPTEDKALVRIQGADIVTRIVAKYPNDRRGRARVWRRTAAIIIKKHELYQK
jgi:hypothetical protein